eukprot:TRINITY_DN31451_c0_g1_i1.p2 TRINITY_DN31451_c0_g1~~TRINITY_DN31451_c0_g1_i1.p2  ORF type:complete len:133 (+),score=35.10 TRINITY_DN31451_c0_g1_i1:57-455(+)
MALSRCSALLALLSAGLAAAANLRQGRDAEAAAHLPLKPGNLKDYKGEAESCLSFCASLKDTCFRGCLDDCTKKLGPPPCASFALQPSCTEPCGKLGEAFTCLQSVGANSTEECHTKLSAVKMSEEDECKIR